MRATSFSSNFVPSSSVVECFETMASLFSDDSDCPPDVLDALRLAMIPGIGPRLRESLLTALGSPAAILSAPREILLQTLRTLRSILYYSPERYLE